MSLDKKLVTMLTGMNEMRIDDEKKCTIDVGFIAFHLKGCGRCTSYLVFCDRINEIAYFIYSCEPGRRNEWSKLCYNVSRIQWSI